MLVGFAIQLVLMSVSLGVSFPQIMSGFYCRAADLPVMMVLYRYDGAGSTLSIDSDDVRWSLQHRLDCVRDLPLWADDDGRPQGREGRFRRRDSS